jgi:SAM-dependent methyltransferase
MSDKRLIWPAPERNKQPLLKVLKRVLPKTGLVLEIASGTGQHVSHFAQKLPKLEWQPTDLDPVNLASIEAWRSHTGAANIRAPLQLDVRLPWPVRRADAIVNCNLIHIAPWSVTEDLFRGAKRTLRPGAVIVMYGPYRIGGHHTAPSNQAFDDSLRRRNPAWGVRDLDTVRDVAGRLAIRCEEVVQMPANNLAIVYRL